MEYVEESPRKVWIRYLAPAWTYPGTALHALPLGIRRTVFSTWHPRNGELIGCLRLGWVSTKLIDEGDPYDEGFFIEHDRDLAPHERARFEVHATTPEYDPARAPRLDPAVWPEARLLKANRNYAGEYFRDAIDQLTGLIGPHPTHAILAHAMRVLATQFIHELAAEVGISRFDAEGLADLQARLFRACGYVVAVEAVSSSFEASGSSLRGIFRIRPRISGARCSSSTSWLSASSMDACA
jgi:hypothetical protein